MALAPHQKAVVELAAVNTRVGEVIARLRKLAPHPQVEAACAELERVRGPLTRAHEKLTTLPANYSPHESKIATTNIAVGSIVGIREAHKKKYASLLSAEEMDRLEVTVVGTSCAVKTLSGVQMLVARGHLVTAATQAEEGTNGDDAA